MKKFINFGSIKQLDNILRDIKHTTYFVGVDENGNAIYDNTKKLPIVSMVGTEKIHGTNAAVCYNNIDGFWVQSRNNIITPDNDNAACAFSAYNNSDAWLSIIKELSQLHNIDLDKHTISVFFEWCGGNIQKLSAFTGHDKVSMIFQYFKCSDIENDSDVSAKWLETFNVCDSTNNIFNIMNYPNLRIIFDFEKFDENKNKLIDYVLNEIEPQSKVGKVFGYDNNVGEGIVCTFEFGGTVYRFKVKGEKHANSKVRTLKKSDIEKVQKVNDVVEYVAKPFRLEQAWQTVFGIDNEKKTPDRKYTGEFIKAVMSDVIKEESEYLIKNELEPKDIGGALSKVCNLYFVDMLNEYNKNIF